MHVPGYDVVYSNNALVKRLMMRAGKRVKAVPFFRRAYYNATKIRQRMKKGVEWKDRVPRAVERRLEKMHAEERVKKL